MKNTYILYIVLLFSYFILGQQNNLELLYQWDDENIIGTTWYDNAYNEIWGFVQNGYEFAVIGSTQGTHIFNVHENKLGFKFRVIHHAAYKVKQFALRIATWHDT